MRELRKLPLLAFLLGLAVPAPSFGAAAPGCGPSPVRPHWESSKERFQQARKRGNQCSGPEYTAPGREEARASCQKCVPAVFNMLERLIPMGDEAIATEERLACQGATAATGVAATTTGAQEATELAQQRATTAAAEAEKARATNLSRLSEAMADCRKTLEESCQGPLSTADAEAMSRLRDQCNRTRGTTMSFITDKILNGKTLGQVAAVAGLAAAGLGVAAMMNKQGSGGSSPSGLTGLSGATGGTDQYPTALKNRGSGSGMSGDLGGGSGSLANAGKAGNGTSATSTGNGTVGVQVAGASGTDEKEKGTGASTYNGPDWYNKNNKQPILKAPEKKGLNFAGGDSSGASSPGGGARGSFGGGGAGAGGGGQAAKGGDGAYDPNFAANLASARSLAGLKGGSEELDDLAAFGAKKKQDEAPLDDLSLTGSGLGADGAAAAADPGLAKAESLFKRVRARINLVADRLAIAR